MINVVWLAVVIKFLAWSLLVPLWHFPDEQAHFGHVVFIAEGGELPRHGRYPDMTEEIYTSLTILGTKRDEKGNNKFTFHPEYRLPYSDNLTGPQEEEIKSLPLSTRKNFVIRESAYYPHFFYQVSALVYKFFYPADLFVRVFAVRLFWLAAHLLMVWLVYLTAKLIFPQNQFLVLTSAILAGFHPMLSFVSAGVTSDNLHNLLYTAVIYLSLKIAALPRRRDFLWLSLVLGVGLINKQQFFIAFTLVVPALVAALIKNRKKTLQYLALLPLVLLVALVLSPARTKNLLAIFFSGQLPYLTFKVRADRVLPDLTLWQHFKATLTHTVREVLPWYWGVFNWLGVVLPRAINRILMRLLAISGLGLMIKLISIIKNKQWTKQTLLLGLTAWAALGYFLSLFIWDFSFTRNNGFSFGVQGRYYFPVISAQMILLAVGVNSVFALFGRRVARYWLLILSLWFLALNLIALFVVASAYYDVTSLSVFIIQASQYKPFFAKGIWLAPVLFAYLASIILLSVKLTQKCLKR